MTHRGPGPAPLASLKASVRSVLGRERVVGPRSGAAGGPVADPDVLATLSTAELGRQLRAAIADGALVLHYQPQFNAVTGQVLGFEALVRWEHPELGLLLPRDFLPAARGTALTELSTLVVDRAMTDLSALRTLAPGATLAVNDSAHHLHDLSLVPRLVEQVRASGHDCSAVVLELTEQTTAATARTRALLDTLHEHRIRVSIRSADIDDAGASPSLWANPAVREIKIDPTTIAALLDDPGLEQQARAMISAARVLDVRTVAEGVESAVAVPRLRALGVDVLQGYWLGAPVPLGELQRSARYWPAVRRDIQAARTAVPLSRTPRRTS